MDKKYICPCGLTCCDCLFYKSEIYEAARKLKELIIEHQFDKFLALTSSKESLDLIGEHMDLSESEIPNGIGQIFEPFRQMPDFMYVLDNIIKLHCKNTCQETGGCSFGGKRYECKTIKCIKSKKYEGCWECNEFENCETLKTLKKFYGYVIDENLKITKEKGVGAIKSHGDKYYAWQRYK